MKNNYFRSGVIQLILLFFSTCVFATTYTCVKTGNWNNKNTWGTATTPGAADNVVITGGFTVTVNTASTISNVTINSGSTLKISSNLTVSQKFTNNGSVSGNSSLLLKGTGIVITGTGSYTTHKGTIQFRSSPETIDVGVVISKTTGNVILSNSTTPGITVTNNGQVLLTGGTNTLTTSSTTKASTFTMGANSVLSVSAAALNNNFATLNASASGCTVNYYGGTYNIKIPSSSTYYDLAIQAGTKTNTAALTMHSLTVASGATLKVAGFNLKLSGNWTNNGTIQTNTGTVTFNGTSSQTITDASGTAAFATVVMSGTGTLNFASNVSTTSSFTISSGTVDATAANKNLTDGASFTNNGTFTARKGTVTMNGAAAHTIGGTSSTTFYNLTLSSSTATLGNSITVGNTLLISGGTLDVSTSNYSITVGNTFTNNSAFTQRNGTVTFSGNTSTPLTLGGTAATTFYNLTINTTNSTDVVDLGRAITISNNFTLSKGSFNSQNFQVTGNATGTMTMAANTGLLLGLTTSATNILFPSNYTAAHITLNSTSTVTYQANTGQTISAVPTYGNVIVTNGAATVTKTLSASPVNIAGNFTITKGTGTLTVSATTRTINLTGNYTSNGVLSFSTGAFNIGGNFTNNGTFTAGTSTVTFDGSAAQSLGGTTATTFDLLTINNSTASTITLGNNTTVSSNFTNTKGNFDVSASNYSLTVGGTFTNSSTFTARSGTVTLNGAINQSITGTSTTSFYNLTLSGKTITLNHNESLQSVLTLNSGALNGPDTLTMISNSSLTARIAPVAAAATIGATFVMQRYISGTTANYQSLASPAKASILKDWDYDAGFYMSGVTGNDGNAISSGNIYFSVYTFNETKDTYDSVNTDNQPLTPGLGIYLWMGNSLSSFSPFTFDTRGIPNVGNVNYTVTKNDLGTNLIGNPYASPLQWTTFQTANSGKIGTTFYVFDETTGNWESSNGTTGSGGRIASNPNILPAHQGFMVVASAAGVITFKEAHKSTTDASVIRMADPSDMIRIQATTNANSFSGHTLIQFNDSSADLYSPYEDALYIKSHLTNVPVVYALSQDGQQLIHDIVPAKEDAKDITLYAGSGDEGLCTLTFTNVNSLSKYNCVQLEDVKNGKWVAITEDSKYSFAAEKGQMYKFVLHFKALQPGQDCNVPESVASLEQNSMAGVDILPAQVGAQVRFTLPASQEVTISAYNALGQQVVQNIRADVMDNSVDVPLPATHDIYIVRVQSPYGVVNKRIYR